MRTGARAGFATTEVADEPSQLAPHRVDSTGARARLAATNAAGETSRLASAGETLKKPQINKHSQDKNTPTHQPTRGKGRTRGPEGLLRPLKGLIRPLKGLRRPLRAL